MLSIVPVSDSYLVLPRSHLNILISTTFMFCMCCFLIDQYSAPLVIIDMVLSCKIFLSILLVYVVHKALWQVYFNHLTFIIYLTFSSFSLYFYCIYKAKLLEGISLWYLLSFYSHESFIFLHFPTV